MIHKVIVVKHPSGLNIRAAAELVKLASKFKSQMVLWKEKMSANAKSLISLLTLGAHQGTRLKLVVEGEDAEQALDALFLFFESGLEASNPGKSEPIIS
jgi:phosphocarrier protein HPr